MSLSDLNAAVEKSKLFNEGKLPSEEMEAIRQRLAESYERMKFYDWEIEEKVKARRVTPELLNKVCNL
jgi:hypothetical protein